MAAGRFEVGTALLSLRLARGAEREGEEEGQGEGEVAHGRKA